MIDIRSAEPPDAALILTFIRKLAEYEHLLHRAEVTQADILRDLFGPGPRIFCDIALWNGAPAGFSLWFYNYSTFRGRHGVYIEDLFVEPALRRHGIGRALLARLARHCLADGLGGLEWSMLDWNTPARTFYELLGAAESEEWTTYRLTGDALKRLGNDPIPQPGGLPGSPRSRA